MDRNKNFFFQTSLPKKRIQKKEQSTVSTCTTEKAIILKSLRRFEQTIYRDTNFNRTHWQKLHKYKRQTEQRGNKKNDTSDSQEVTETTKQNIKTPSVTETKTSQN